MTAIDPYRTLEIAPGASQAEIKRAYRRLAKLYHPDSAGERALPRFLAIQVAYETLVDEPGRPRTASRGSAARPTAAPSPAWQADASRARATREAYRARTRRGSASSPVRPVRRSVDEQARRRWRGARVPPVRPVRRVRPAARRAARPAARARPRALGRGPAPGRGDRAGGPRRPSARPAMTAPTASRSTRPGKGRPGTAPAAARTGRSIPRSTPTRASTAPSTWPAHVEGRPARSIRPPRRWARRPPGNGRSALRRPADRPRGPRRPTTGRARTHPRARRATRTRTGRKSPKPTRRPEAPAGPDRRAAIDRGPGRLGRLAWLQRTPADRVDPARKVHRGPHRLGPAGGRPRRGQPGRSGLWQACRRCVPIR